MSALRQRMIEDLRVRNKSQRTIRTYVSLVARYAQHFGKSPDLLGPEEARAFLIHLLEVEELGYSRVNQASSALRFFYTVTLGRDWAIKKIPYAKREQKLPVVLSQQEVREVLASVENIKHLSMLMLAYSAGLRAEEIANLQISNIDSKRMVIHVQHGKGAKDRYVPLSPIALSTLRQYYVEHRPKDCLFHGDHRGRPICTSSVKQAGSKWIKAAVTKKKASLHTLRHSFATHHLEAGTDIRTLQLLMGHSSIRTTCRYLHIAMDKVRGMKTPLDFLGGLKQAS